MHTASIASARFRRDVELLDEIKRDEVLGEQMRRTEVLHQRSKVRSLLLSDAVRVNTNLIPTVDRSFQRLVSFIEGDKPFEAYVFSSPSLNAFITETSHRYIVAVSSGAVDTLSTEELEFVLGHELGHVVFRHSEVAAEALIELGPLDTQRRMLVRAWQRAAEISADRAGLICCGSLEVAATALFKTLCGLKLPGVVIDPDEFAHQWDGLLDEVLDQGDRDHWQLSHPFPPLRMKALMLFWRYRRARDVDAEVARLLAHMDGGRGAAGAEHDPLLSRFTFWGGIYVALADGDIEPNKLDALRSIAPPGADVHSLLGTPVSLTELCLERFREAKQNRRQKLSATELHRIALGLVDFAARDGMVTDRGVAHLQQLGRELGLGTGAIRLLIAKRLQEEN